MTGRAAYNAGMGRGHLVAVAVVVSLAGCRPSPPRGPAPTWQTVQPDGAPQPLYFYADEIAGYAPDDRGAYVVRVDGDAAARRAIGQDLARTVDVFGDDGFVVRGTAAEAAAWAARPGVRAVAPLQPVDRRGVLVDRGTELPEVRVELFADAAPAEVDALTAWITWRGGQVLWRGKAAVRARLPHEARVEASRLSSVRWIE